MPTISFIHKLQNFLSVYAKVDSLAGQQHQKTSYAM